MQLGRDLHEAGRFHLHRRALLSGLFALTDAAAASRVLISAEAVPYRPNRGVRVVVQEAAGDGPDVHAECAVPGVAGAWSFGDERYRITVSWLDDEPLDVVTRVPAPPPQTLFDGGFETITPWQWDWFD
jgi:hypothetical protein